MQTYHSFLVGIDFTACSDIALRHAIRLARGFGAKLSVVHVIDATVAMELEEALSEFQRNIREGLINDARRAWSEYAAAIPGAAELPFDVRIDNRQIGLLNAVGETGANLLILGAFGRQLPDVGLGTTASSAVRRCACDVLLVRETQAGPFKTVVAGIDFSEASAVALRRAAAVAKADGAVLHVVHVFDAPWHRLHYRAPTVEMAPQFVKQYRDGLHRRLEEFTRDTLGGMPTPPPHCELFDHGAHRSGMVAFAQQVNADLVVLGARGKTRVRDFIMGSTAEKVLKYSTCSVLSVKDDALIADDKS